MNPHTLISSQVFNSIPIAFALILIIISGVAMACGGVGHIAQRFIKPAPVARPRNRRISPRQS